MSSLGCDSLNVGKKNDEVEGGAESGNSRQNIVVVVDEVAAGSSPGSTSDIVSSVAEVEEMESSTRDEANQPSNSTNINSDKNVTPSKPEDSEPVSEEANEKVKPNGAEKHEDTTQELNTGELPKLDEGSPLCCRC